jgi:hypothetical protein
MVQTPASEARGRGNEGDRETGTRVARLRGMTYQTKSFRVCKPSTVLLGALVLAAGLVACGGDEEGSTAGTPGSGASGGSGGGDGGTGAQGGGEGGAGAQGGGTGGTANERRVFVSSEMYDGNMGGVVGADDACQTLADAASLGGTWKAWVGDGTASPETTFVQSELPYVLVGGGTVANDWADLTDATLQAAIDHDETGTAIDPGSNTHVWTGASTTGGPLPYHCEGWTSTVPDFTPRGLLTATDSTWVMAGPDPCATPNHIYCFEQ